MPRQKATPVEQAPSREPVRVGAREARVTRASTMIAMMRAPTGATASELGAAVGWQRHSVRGFIAGTLKKRPGLMVLTERTEAGTRYRLVEGA